MGWRTGTGRCAPVRRPTRLRLERLVGDALPVSGTAAVSGSMLLRRSPVLPPFVMHVKPVDVPQPDYGARHVAAMVLIVEPGRQRRVDPDLMARTLGADTAGESGGGLVGGRQDRARHGPGDWAHGTRHLLASAADLPEAVHLAASGPWCGWCCRSPNSNERRRCRHFPGASTWRGYLRHGRTPAFLTPT